MTDSETRVILGVVFVIGFQIYFLPSFIAKLRKHSKLTAIFVLNILVGWTMGGWVIAIVWAFTEKNNVIKIKDDKKKQSKNKENKTERNQNESENTNNVFENKWMPKDLKKYILTHQLLKEDKGTQQNNKKEDNYLKMRLERQKLKRRKIINEYDDKRWMPPE